MLPDMQSIDHRDRLRLWLKKAGVAGFVFFLAKGLLWLVVSGALAWMGAGL